MSGLRQLQSSIAKSGRSVKISFFGDSITMQGGYVRLIEESLANQKADVTIFRHGLNGGRVLTLLEGKSPWGSLGGPMKEILSKEKPDIAVVFIGVNDVWHAEKGTTEKEFEKGLRKIIQLCSMSECKVVLSTLAVIGEKTDGSNPDDKKLDHYAAITLNVAKETGAVPVYARSAFLQRLKAENKNAEKGTLTTDGVHMNPAGDALLADLIATGLAKAIKDKESEKISQKKDQ